MGELKLENLQRMRDHLDTIDEDMFNLNYFRSDNSITPECETAGCIVGHCIGLAEDFEDYVFRPEWPVAPLSPLALNYKKWVRDFVGTAIYSNIGIYLFGMQWVDESNLADKEMDGLEHAKERLDDVIKHNGDLTKCIDYDACKGYFG
jgi:hypothetical protein